MSTSPESTFRDRINWILRTRPELENSESQLAEKAGMTRTALNKVLVRSDERGGVPRMKAHFMSSLAAAARVDRHWLETGEGSADMTMAAVPGPDVHAMRKEAAEMLQEGHGLTAEQAWFLMRDAAPATVSSKAFYLEGVRFLKERASLAESSEKVEVLPRSKPAEIGNKLRRSQPVPKRNAASKTNS